MLDVLFLTVDDWANTGWRFFKCAQLAGFKTMGFKGNYHTFQYPEQLLLHQDLVGVPFKRDPIVHLGPGTQLSEAMRSAKIIHYIASTCVVIPEVNLFDVPTVMQHGGRTYRTMHEKLNPVYNQFCDAAIVQMPDLLGKGADNENFIYFPVDTKLIRPRFEKSDPTDRLVIGHFGSQPVEKGTDRIEAVIKSLGHLSDKFEFRTASQDSNRLVWLENLDRMRDCDLIIDVFTSKTVEGLDYGEWGNTAFEAAALGKVVLTMSLHFDKYLEEYGDCALNITNSEDELAETLTRFIEMPRSELRREKEKTRAWIEAKHSLEATAKKLEPIYRKLLRR